MSNIMPEARNLLPFLVTIRLKFHAAKADERRITPDLVTIVDQYLAAKPLDYVHRLLHEFDCMSVNYDIFNRDRAALGELLHDEAKYSRKRMSYATKAILYGQFVTLQQIDQVRLDFARSVAEQEEFAS